MSKNRPLSPALRARLVRLNAALASVLSFETVTANRDPRTGAFTRGAGGTDPRAVRAAFSTARRPVNPKREAFKAALLASLRTRRSR